MNPKNSIRKQLRTETGGAERIVMICSILQILGIPLVILKTRLPMFEFLAAPIAVCGFSAIVVFFLLKIKLITIGAAIAGGGLIFLACIT